MAEDLGTRMAEESDHKSGLYVEFHAWPEGSPNYQGHLTVRDVTRFVGHIGTAHSINPPWGGLDLTLEIPLDLVFDIFPGHYITREFGGNSGNTINNGVPTDFAKTVFGQDPEPGFWIVVGHQTVHGKRAFGFFRCVDIDIGYVSGPSGTIETMPVIVRGENFLSLLMSAVVQLTPIEGTWSQKGAIYSIDSWTTTLTALCGSVLAKSPGEILAEIWRTLVQIILPPSLSGLTIGEQVPIVHNETQAGKYAPLRIGSTQAISGLEMNSAAENMPNKTILSFLQGLIGGDSRAIEFFPSLEFSPNVFEKGLAFAIGARPVVVYRLKPFVTKAINMRNVSSSVGNAGGGSGQTASEKTGLFQKAVSTNQNNSAWKWYDFDVDEITSIRFKKTDADRVNMTHGSGWTNDLGPDTFGATGVPLIRDPDQIARHGLRPTKLQWPFYQGSTNTAPQHADFTPGKIISKKKDDEGINNNASSPIDYNNAMCEMAWAFCGEGEKFWRGTAQLRYFPWIVGGHWARFDFGKWRIAAYVETVIHDIQVDRKNSGHITAYTTVSFSRGTLQFARGATELAHYQAPLMTAARNPHRDTLQGLELEIAGTSRQNDRVFDAQNKARTSVTGTTTKAAKEADAPVTFTISTSVPK